MSEKQVSRIFDLIFFKKEKDILMTIKIFTFTF